MAPGISSSRAAVHRLLNDTRPHRHVASSPPHAAVPGYAADDLRIDGRLSAHHPAYGHYRNGSPGALWHRRLDPRVRRCAASTRAPAFEQRGDDRRSAAAEEPDDDGPRADDSGCFEDLLEAGGECTFLPGQARRGGG